MSRHAQWVRAQRHNLKRECSPRALFMNTVYVLDVTVGSLLGRGLVCLDCDGNCNVRSRRATPWRAQTSSRPRKKCPSTNRRRHHCLRTITKISPSTTRGVLDDSWCCSTPQRVVLCAFGYQVRDACQICSAYEIA